MENKISEESNLFKTYKLINERIDFCNSIIKNSKDIEQVKSFLFPKYICDKSQECIRYIWGTKLLPVNMLNHEHYNYCVNFLKTHTSNYIQNMVDYSQKTSDVSKDIDIQMEEKIENEIRLFNDCLVEILFLQELIK